MARFCGPLCILVHVHYFVMVCQPSSTSKSRRFTLWTFVLFVVLCITQYQFSHICSLYIGYRFLIKYSDKVYLIYSNVKL